MNNRPTRYSCEANRVLGKRYGWERHKNGWYKVPDGYQIHHIDGDYTNNDPSNLVLLTIEEHLKVHEETRRKILAENSKNQDRYCRPVLCHQTGITYESVRECARQLGINNHRRICECINSKYRRKSYKGYTFEYAEKGR